MAEQYFFFNSVSGDEREYDQNQFSAALKYIADSNGISSLDYDDPLAVQRMPNGDIAINAGAMLIEGYVYVNDSTLILPSASYLQGEPRTDRVIVRLDRSIDVREIHAEIVHGTDNSAAPPDLIRADNAYDMGIALIKWDGTTTIVEDTRSDSTVCGYIRDQYATHDEMEAYEAALSQQMSEMQATVEQEMQQTQATVELEMQQTQEEITEQMTALQQQVGEIEDTVTQQLATQNTQVQAQLSAQNQAVANQLAEQDRQVSDALYTKQNLLKTTDVTLTATGWMPYSAGTDDAWQQTVTVGGLTTAQNFAVYYAPSSKYQCQEANISALDTTVDELITFVCADKPDVDVVVRVEPREINVDHTDDDIYGLEVDYQNRLFKRLAGATTRSAGSGFDDIPCYGGRYRCNLTDDGVEVAKLGDAGYTETGQLTQSITVGGTTYPVGTNVQVMVRQPRFYYRMVPLKLDPNTVSGIGYHVRKARYYIAATKKPGFKLFPCFYDEDDNETDHIYLSAYEGALYDASMGKYFNDGTDTDTALDTVNDRICSVAGPKPISGAYKNLSKPNFETIASARGTGWHGDLIKAECANLWLMMIELGTMNTQVGITSGVVNIAAGGKNDSAYTGSTAALGDGTGKAATTNILNEGVEEVYGVNGKTSVSYRGMENPWGNIWKHINGINIWGDGSMSGGQPYVAKGFTFNESSHSGEYEPVGFTLANVEGYINAMGYGDEKFDWLLTASETGGNSSLPVGDYSYFNSNMNGYRIVRLGGGWSNGAHAGGFYWYCAYGVGSRDVNIGGRLVYVPAGRTD